MTRWRNWGVVAFAMAVLIAGVSRAVICQQPIGPAASSNPMGTRLDELFAQAKPDLEDVLGGTLNFQPQYRTVTSAELAAIPDRDLEAHLRWHFPDLRNKTLMRTKKIAGVIVAKASVARYAEGENVI